MALLMDTIDFIEYYVVNNEDNWFKAKGELGV